MNESTPPTTFAELLKRATNQRASCSMHHDVVLLFERLFEWAKAGGVDELRKGIEALEAMPLPSDSAYWKYRHAQVDKLRASLALLDGKK